jgi:hypothetical protein
LGIPRRLNACTSLNIELSIIPAPVRFSPILQELPSPGKSIYRTHGISAYRARGNWQAVAAVEPAFEDRGDTPIAEGAETEFPAGGRLRAVQAVDFTESHDPQAGTITLLGMGPSGHDRFIEPASGRPPARRPTGQLLRRPLEIRLMGFRHMARDRRMPTAFHTPHGIGNLNCFWRENT